MMKKMLNNSADSTFMMDVSLNKENNPIKTQRSLYHTHKPVCVLEMYTLLLHLTK